MTVVLLSLVLGGLLAAPALQPVRTAVAGPHTALAAPAGAPLPSAVVTHGDLVVGAKQTYVIQPTQGSSTYYQGGNITVENGGTLDISGVTLSFVQFVGPNGTAQQRLAHIFHFTDAGTVVVTNSTITTNVLGVNVYAKLSVVVSGNLTLWNSTIAFPGSISVTGAQGNLTLNRSVVEANPMVSTLHEWSLLKADTSYAPSISVTNGAALNLFASNITDLYADNFTQNGIPGPAPLVDLGVNIQSGVLPINFSTPTDSANLTRDYLYNGVSGGELTFNYTNPSAAYSPNLTISYGGNSYNLGIVNFTGFTSGSTAIPFPQAFVAGINSAGMLNYLNYTGDFGTPSQIVITASSGVGSVLADVSFILSPADSNDLTVSGLGSTISTVDSSIDLTFNNLPSSPLSLTPPLPWLSNKLVLSNGATGYLGNLTVENPIHQVFSTSAILADATSHAYLFRWATFHMTGEGGVLPVQNGTASAYYAYNTNQTNNATANALNQLHTSDPAIWNYLQYWDAAHGAPAYATSGASGTASVLLASNEISGASLPGGQFLGGYHIILAVPLAGVTNEAFNWSVSTYPIGVAPGTPGYGLPDAGPTTDFPTYVANLTVSSVAVLVNGAASTSVRYGQYLHVDVTIKDNGTAPIYSVLAGLYYTGSYVNQLAYNQTGVNLTASGMTATVGLDWLVTDSVTGLRGNFSHVFHVEVLWYNGNPALGGGVVDAKTSTVSLHASQIVVGNVTAPPTTSLDAQQRYVTTGDVTYNGTHSATVELVAVSGGAKIVLGVAHPTPPPGPMGGNVSFQIDWGPSSLASGTGYTLEVVAYYNGNPSNATVLPGTYSLPSSTPSNIIYTSVLGLPLWLLLVIVVAIVAAVVGLLWFMRHQAAGKLVECGECGNLIPEAARVCPKCGAEFETDVVRCSRCASTIPANSKFCPECAAQLLGKPEDGAADPERQAYAGFTERFRAEGKKELGENYSEGAFWDWWKRQPTYTPFSQWRLQQGQGTPRTGMSAPPAGASQEQPSTPPRRPPSGGGSSSSSTSSSGGSGGKPTSGAKAGGAESTPAGAAPASGSMKACPSCSREIPTDYVVCPFCGSVTQ